MEGGRWKVEGREEDKKRVGHMILLPDRESVIVSD